MVVAGQMRAAVVRFPAYGGRMVKSVARVVTDQPGRYVKQLVSHLGHRLSADLADDGTAVVAFETGSCTLTPEPGELRLDASATDTEALARIRDVVGRHLERFGGREGLQVTWSDAAG